MYRVKPTRGSLVARRFLAHAALFAASCLAASHAPLAQLLVAAEPPSIEKVIIDANGRSEIEGLGRAGDVVELISAGQSIGQAQVASNGRWRVVLANGLKAGTYQIRAEARSSSASAAALGDEVRVAIPTNANSKAVVAYDGVTGANDRLTRQRAEELAVAAGQAYEEVATESSSPKSGDRDRIQNEPGAEADRKPDQNENVGPLSIVIEWLKRSARVYREDVVSRLAEPRDRSTPQTPSEPERMEPVATEVPISVGQAAKEIEAERSRAESRRMEIAEADKERKAQEALKAAEDAAKREDAKRKKAEELARRKAEADKRIADELERLKRAKEEADKAKTNPEPSTATAPPQKAKITLEPFTLPGQKPAASKDGVGVAALSSGSKNIPRSRVSGRCGEGRVTFRKGRRWYVTGANDTLWDIAERYYGTGSAYRRIYSANRKRLSSPHIVRPCLALRLPGRG